MIVNNSFEAVLRNQRNGALLSELSEELQRVTQAVREQGKPGKLVISLTIASANGDASALSVLDEVRAKVPQPKRSNSLFYATDDNRLVRDNPRQKDLELTVAPAPVVANVEALNQALQKVVNQ